MLCYGIFDTKDFIYEIVFTINLIKWTSNSYTYIENVLTEIYTIEGLTVTV